MHIQLPLVFTDSEPWVKNTVFGHQLLKSTDGKPWGTEPTVYLLKKNPHMRTRIVHTHIVQRSTVEITGLGWLFTHSQPGHRAAAGPLPTPVRPAPSPCSSAVAHLGPGHPRPERHRGPPRRGCLHQHSGAECRSPGGPSGGRGSEACGRPLLGGDEKR